MKVGIGKREKRTERKNKLNVDLNSGILTDRCANCVKIRTIFNPNCVPNFTSSMNVPKSIESNRHTE
jgi:hypothetical protein